jgi:histidine triad (HIT) family protein
VTNKEDLKMNCLFCKIIAGDVPAKIQYEDDKVIAFEDIHPQAPVHILIIPRLHIATCNDLSPETAYLMGDMAIAASRLAKEKGINENGYRLVTNCNGAAGQTVFHLHTHLLGGRNLSWPPG